MINEKELQAIKLSPTKKDYYQVWNELLETAGKISEIWKPDETNESDPGIVLLKVLTAICDKLNYTIDKNILEAFMPSASQEDSMRKLCEMMGYNIKYYQSAKTYVKISYIGEKDMLDTGIVIPKYTTIKNMDETIVYTTLQEETLKIDMPSVSVECVEGNKQVCNNGMPITAALLDDNHRYYLPEHQIAENAIFVYNASASTAGDNTSYAEDETHKWEQVNNLNTQALEQLVYKFGYDSKLGLPYLQFPDDINEIIKDGILVTYFQTNGINGNISANTLATLDVKQLTSLAEESLDLSEKDFSVTNTLAVKNGSNIETIDQAYNNYKKTIGTFDTLVTCRDYMNKIYQLTNDLGAPFISNIIVSDIRDDINYSLPMITFDDNGIFTEDIIIDSKNTSRGKPIDHFNLILYPFNTFTGITTNSNDYKNSFKLCNNTTTRGDIETELAAYKTIAHTFCYPVADSGATDIAGIKNYLKLNAKITTNYKVGSLEERDILTNIRKAIYNTFNARNIDFGDEIPFDSILTCIEQADARIKNVSLEEPETFIRYLLATNYELEPIFDADHDITAVKKFNAQGDIIETEESDLILCKKLYNELTLRNILSGKINMFNYDSRFEPTLEEKQDDKYKPVYPTDDQNTIIKMTSSFEPDLSGLPVKGLTLKENEVIKFRAPNFRTKITYPAYVNYYLYLQPTDNTKGTSANIMELKEFLKTNNNWTEMANSSLMKSLLKEVEDEIKDSDAFSKATIKYGCIFIKDDDGDGDGDYKECTSYVKGKVFYYIPFGVGKSANQRDSENIFIALQTWIKNLPIEGTTITPYIGLLTDLGYDKNYIPGYLVTEDKIKYKKANRYIFNYTFSSYFVQAISDGDPAANNYGLGLDPQYTAIQNNTDYQLRSGEYLLINYTSASNDTSNENNTESLVINKTWPAGTIIRPSGFTNGLTTSESYALTHSYSKTSGFEFSQNKPEGMFTLGPSEQIEIRTPVEVTLGKTDTNKTYNFYWQLQDSSKTTFFLKDEQSYTLKNGEYLIWTDDRKIDLAMYGSGTEIIRSNTNFNIPKKLDTSSIRLEDLLSMTSLDQIPWMSSILNNTNYMTIKEYQYITLTSEDTLNQVTGYTSDEEQQGWHHVDDAYYTLASNKEVIQSLPKISIDSTDWQVKCSLDFNMGPTKAQVLHENDKITLSYNGPSETVIEGTDEGISLKSNYAVQTATSEVNTEITITDPDDKPTKITDFSLKVFAQTATNIDKCGSNFGNYSANWTKVNLSDFSTANNEELKLNVLLPSNDYFGLIMFYFRPEDDKTTIQLTLETGSNGVLGIYNNNINGKNNTWWKDSTEYFLKSGINIVYIPQSCTMKVTPNDSANNRNGTLIFSKLDIIKDTNKSLGLGGINTLIHYQAIDEEITPMEQLREDILKIDFTEQSGVHVPDKFYYNALVDNSAILDINEAAGEDLTIPNLLFDYNNINNKFVISEIDADYLVNGGLTLTKSSKL